MSTITGGTPARCSTSRTTRTSDPSISQAAHDRGGGSGRIFRDWKSSRRADSTSSDVVHPLRTASRRSSISSSARSSSSPVFTLRSPTLRISILPLHDEITKTRAFVFKNWIMTKRNVFTVFEILFWPVVGLLSVGLLAQFAALQPEVKASSSWGSFL